jgi:hypothetical protein
VTATAGTCAGGPPPSAPFSGELDAGSGAKIVDLGLGCFYLGGGHNTGIAGLGLSGSGNTDFSLTGTGPTFTVGGSAGTGKKDCTRGAGPGRHCISSTNFGLACTSDANCDSTRAGSCAADANCFFGAPLSLSAFNACVVNVVSADASGSLDETTGAATLTVPLSFRAYLAACPVCSGGACSGGQTPGAACTPQDANGFTVECLPAASGYFTSIALTLPLVTGPPDLPPSGISTTGSFCPSQAHAGAFGPSFTRRVLETGMPAGDLSDRAPHTATLAASFCVGDGGSVVDAAADLPGPPAGSILGTLQVQ